MFLGEVQGPGALNLCCFQVRLHAAPMLLTVILGRPFLCNLGFGDLQERSTANLSPSC